MAAAVIDAIGIVSGGLGIVSFFQGLLPGERPPQGAIIKIKAGNPGDEDVDEGGDIAATYAWDINNNYLGQSGGVSIGIGGAEELTIDSYSAGSRADFAAVAAENNAVCIAWITVKMYDGTVGGAWTGDIGFNCGQGWYTQTEQAGTLKDSTTPYIPNCSWLDADHTDDIAAAALKFRVTAYAENVVDTVNNAHQCDSTLWGPDSAPINGIPAKRSHKLYKDKPRKPWMENVLIQSNITQHKAADLCNSDTSWGPDFIGTDGAFCDMGTHTLSPLCSTEDVDGCVSVDDASKAVLKRSIGPKRAVEQVHKKYTKIKHWESKT